MVTIAGVEEFDQTDKDLCELAYLTLHQHGIVAAGLSGGGWDNIEVFPHNANRARKILREMLSTTDIPTGTFQVVDASDSKRTKQMVYDRTEIESVLWQRGKITKENELVELATNVLTGNPDVLGEIKSISAGKCPADFREAWLAYVLDLENLRARLTLLAEIDPGEKSAVSLLRFGATNSVTGPYFFDGRNRVGESWKKVELLAVKYGVTP